MSTSRGEPRGSSRGETHWSSRAHTGSDKEEQSDYPATSVRADSAKMPGSPEPVTRTDSKGVSRGSSKSGRGEEGAGGEEGRRTRRPPISIVVTSPRDETRGSSGAERQKGRGKTPVTPKSVTPKSALRVSSRGETRSTSGAVSPGTANRRSNDASLRPSTRWAVQPASGIRWARQAPQPVQPPAKSVKFSVQSLQSTGPGRGALTKSFKQTASLEQLKLTDIESDDEFEAHPQSMASSFQSTHLSAAFAPDTLKTFATLGRWRGQYSSVAAKLQKVTTTSWENMDIRDVETDVESKSEYPASSRSGSARSIKTADLWLPTPQRETSGGLEAVWRATTQLGRRKKRSGGSRMSLGTPDPTSEAETLLVSNTWTDPAEQVKTAWNFKTGNWTRDEVKKMKEEILSGGAEVDTHGGTWHPRLPAFFKDPRKRLTEALLNRDKKAIDDELRYQAFDQISLEKRPGSEAGLPFRRRRAQTPVEEEPEEMPKEYEVVEEEEIYAFGHSENGQLGTVEMANRSVPVAWDKDDILDRYYLQRRIRSITLGWYHGVLISRQRWNMRTPPDLPVQAYKDEERYPIMAWAQALLDWASPDFIQNIRAGGLPERPEELVDKFPREQVLSMYEEMLQYKKFVGVKCSNAVYTWGLNSHGQLGHGDKDDRPILEPVHSLLGVVVLQVACGGFHTILLAESGALLAFGLNKRGQLGIGNCTSVSEPVCVTTLTRPKERVAYQASSPSNVLLLQNLESNTSERDVRECFEEFFGYKKLLFINADYSETELGQGVARPQVLLYFKDEVTASQARLKKNGDFLGGQHLDDRLKISFFHKEDAGKDLRAWLSTSQAPCLLKKGVEIRQILAGFDHTMALLSNGQVAGWGNNKLGQVGTPMKAGVDPELVLKIPELRDGVGQYIELLPVMLPFTSDLTGKDATRSYRVSSMAIGGNHSMFLTTDGLLMTCGSNDYGQLGLGPHAPKKQHGVVQVMAIAKTGKSIRSLVCGASHTFCIMRDASVYGWGRNDCGQTGVFSEGDAVHFPMPVEALAGLKAVTIASNEHTLAVCEDYEVRTFGNNTKGQLGAADELPRQAEVDPEWAVRGVRMDPLCGAFSSFLCTRLPLVSALHHHTDCLFSWGYSKHGELGQGQACHAVRGTAVGCKVPTLVTALHALEIEDFACGWYHAFATVRDKGVKQVYCWGYNRYGQLGIQHFDNEPRPIDMYLQDTFIPAQKIVKISCGGFSSYFIRDDGEVFACGANSRGQLGVGKLRGRAKGPVRIKTLSGKKVTEVVCGFDHCFAISPRAVYGFGGNHFGQLGMGTTEDVKRPEVIRGIDRSRLVMMACGGNHTIVVQTNQVLACGRNDFGQCGIGSKEAPPSLAVVVEQPSSEKHQVKHASCGPSHSMFVLGSGELLGCGRNDMGQLGLGPEFRMVDRLVMILPSEFLEKNKVRQVSCGEHTLVVLEDDAVIACGCNNNGQLGLGHLENQFDFKQLPLDSRRSLIKAGAYHSFMAYAKKFAVERAVAKAQPGSKPTGTVAKESSSTCAIS